MTIRRARSTELSGTDVEAIRALLLEAFAQDEHGGFEEDDWQHALGGVHFVAEEEGAIVSHASVIRRELRVADAPINTGYVEAVATAPAHQRRGFGSAVMREVNAHITADYELGALGTGSQGFYERMGWRTWQGPSFVRMQAGDVATPDEDGYILVLMTPTTPAIDLSARISCEQRAGDDW